MSIEELKKIDEVIISIECPECGKEKKHIAFLSSEEWEFKYNKGIVCCKNCKKAYRFNGNISYIENFL